MLSECWRFFRQGCWNHLVTEVLELGQSNRFQVYRRTHADLILTVMATKEQPVNKPLEGRSSVAPFDLSSFQLELGVLEIRYPLALGLWDKSGALWRSVQGKWPDLRLTHAEPVRTQFQIGKNALKVEVESASVTSATPERSLEEFSTMTKEFFTMTTQFLQISLYKRVGFRVLYFKEFKDKKEASAAFFALRLINVPDGKKFEIDDQPIDPQYIVRWESDKKGVLIQCRVETRKSDFDPPPALESLIKPIHQEKSGIVFDVDYYTVSPVEPGQIDMSQWIKHALHVISRDSGYIFGG